MVGFLFFYKLYAFLYLERYMELSGKNTLQLYFYVYFTTRNVKENVHIVVCIDLLYITSNFSFYVMILVLAMCTSSKTPSDIVHVYREANHNF